MKPPHTHNAPPAATDGALTGRKESPAPTVSITVLATAGIVWATCHFVRNNATACPRVTIFGRPRAASGKRCAANRRKVKAVTDGLAVEATQWIRRVLARSDPRTSRALYAIHAK